MKKVKRIGLLNFWLYDDEELDFYDGKLLLRGKNGSGKSVTMQSFIPLIFDGNKSPTRLDTFGGANKHLEDYILGGFDTPIKEDATSYLYMEIYDDEINKYITIGMGFHARKSRPVDFWGFSITDNRRIGIDFNLYKDATNKIPLTKKELQSELGINNKIVERVEDYKIMVNNLLFGFENLDSYDEFINVILQLRSPKLSKGYTPTQLMQILENVLKPLTEEDLRPLSQAVEEIDKTKDQKEKLNNNIKAINNFLKAYKNYNEVFLYTKTVFYIDKEQHKKKKDIDIKNIISELNSSKTNIDIKSNRLKECNNELERLAKLKENLKDTDINTKVSRKEELTELIKNTSKKKEDKYSLLRDKTILKEKYSDSKASLEKELQNLKEEGLSILEDVQELTQNIKFSETYSILKDLKDDFLTKIDFTNLKLRLSNYKNNLNTILDKLEEKKKIEVNLNKLNEEINIIEKDCNDIIKNITELQSNMDNALVNLKDKIYYLKNNNKQVILSDEDYKNIVDKLVNYTADAYRSAKEIYFNIVNVYEREINKEIANLQYKIKLQNDEVKRLERDLDTLRNSKEEALPISKEVVASLEYLKTNNISSIPFYKAVEFNDNINNETQNKIESLLLTSGLLASNIISSQDKEKVKACYGTYIYPGLKKKNNLTKYLKVSSNIEFSKEIVTKVLESISTDENDDIYLNEDNFKISNILNAPSKTMESIYIGLLKRENIRKKKIEELESNLKSANEILDNLKSMELKKYADIETINYEKNAFPSNKELIDIEEQINSKQIELDIRNKDKNKKVADLEIESKNITILQQELIKLKKDVPLALDVDIFKNVINDAITLDSKISYLDKTQSNYKTKNDTLIMTVDNIKDIDNRYNEIMLDINNYDEILEKYTIEKNTIEEILNSPKYQDIKNTLEEIAKKERDIPQEISNIERSLGILEEKVNNLTNELTTEQESLAKVDEEVKKSSNDFIDEYNLNYVFKDNYTDIYKLAILVKDKLKDKETSNISNAIDNYYSNFNTYRLELNDYHFTNINILENSNNPRCDIRTTYQGRNLNIYELKDALSASLEEIDVLMSSQDEKLFHEILLKTIGNKIKNYIRESNEWVKKINSIMKECQVNTSLSFSLKWEPKEALDEDELDTKELVEYFNKSDRRSDIDTEKLIKHFKNRLNRELELNMEQKTFAEIIFDVLDYRKWYNFKMEYHRSSGINGNLTDKIFSKFSGGERAKAMYIPLLCAVSAKLDNIEHSTLRLIALDEAFAGVDELNIVETLNIINKLNLDYIFTSQSLWCDYSIIRDLSIANLIKAPDNSAIAIQRYRWNGKTKEVILNKEIINETSRIF